MTSKNTARLALAAAGATVLAGCLDSNPTAPVYQCAVRAQPSVVVAGDTVREANGLKYINMELGDTSSRGTNVTASSSVDVCYVGFFPSGQVFDPGQQPLSFVPNANRVIPGFAQGVVGMRTGSTRRIIVPPALGYGSQPVTNPSTGAVVIPANSTLVFDVGVLRVR